jgi:hypothetical protein
MIATLVDQDSPLFRPYVDTFPPLGHLDARRTHHLASLTAAEAKDYEELLREQRRFAKLSHRITSRCFRAAPPAEAFQWAHDVVLQRNVTIPSFCVPSAPVCVGRFLAANAEKEWDMPCLVPLVDALAYPLKDPNCEIYTCIQKEFSHERKVSRVRATTLNMKSHRRIVVCAARDIQAGERLSVAMCRGITRPACLLRFGELPQESDGEVPTADAGELTDSGITHEEAAEAEAEAEEEKPDGPSLPHARKSSPLFHAS